MMASESQQHKKIVFPEKLKMVNTHAGTLSTVHIPYVSHGILTWSCNNLI